MDIQTLLASAQKEDNRYVPCTMPISLYERLVQIKEAEGLSMSGILVLATRWFVECYDGAGTSPREAEAVVEGGEPAGS